MQLVEMGEQRQKRLLEEQVARLRERAEGLERQLRDANGEIVHELWFVLIIATCMNMGSRNASKIAQRFTDRLLEGFSQQLDKYVEAVWLPKQTPELRALLAERKAKLGANHARPFTTEGYTDDFEFTFIGPELTAMGNLIWLSVCLACNFWLSQKYASCRHQGLSLA